MILLAVILVIFIYGMIAATLGTILPDLSERFHLSPSQNGTIAFAQALGLILASLAVGPLLDAEGKKIGLVIGLALIGVALSLLPRSSSYKNVLALLFVLGVGGGIVITGGNALASDVGEAHRATVLNLVNLFFGLGGFVTPFISASLFSKNWVRLCYSIAAFTVSTLILILYVAIPGPSGTRGFAISNLGLALGQPLLYVIGLFLFLYVSCEVGVWNWLPRHLISQGIPESRALYILSIGFALGLLVGRLAVAPILIHISPICILFAASLAMAITTFSMLLTKRPSMALVLVGLSGLSMAPVFPTALAIVGDSFPSMTGTAIGFAITCGWIGLAASSRLIGSIGGHDPRRLRKALMVIPASSFLMIILTVIIHAMMHS